MKRHRTSVIPVAAILLVVSTACDSQSKGLARAQTAPTSDVAETGVRRVWNGDYVEFYASSVSPDGRFVTMIDWESGDLGVRDLLTNSLHRVTSHSSNPDATYHEAHTGVFSRDGRQIAYAWQSDLTADVRVIDFVVHNGQPRETPPRIISANALKYPYYLWDWSPDGSLIIGKQYGTDNTVEIVLFSSDGSSTRTLKTFNWREPLRAAFSPDGRYVAYDLPSDVDRHQRDIFVVSVDGNSEYRVVDAPGYHRLFGWSPQGKILYSTTEGTAAPALWQQPMSGGRPSGDAELIRTDVWRAEPIGYAGGDFYYGLAAERPTLHFADLDLAAGRLAGPPLQVVEPGGGQERGWAWSADGTYLAIIVRDQTQRGRRLIVRSQDGTEVSELAIDLEPWSGRLHWAPDGKSVMMFGRDDNGRLGFYRVTLETGARDVVLHTWALRGHFDWSPDGSTIYFGRTQGGAKGPFTIVARNILTGDEQPVGPIDYYSPIVLSPDGMEMATQAPRTEGDSVVLSVLSLEGGTRREVLRLPPEWSINWINWTPSGDTLLFVANEETWLVPFDGGKVERIDGMSDSRMVRLHPNGKRVAYEIGRSRGEIWVMEGLDRSSKPIGSER